MGAVQFKKEAGLSNLRYHFLVAGGILVVLGLVLLVVKCVFFRVPLPDDYEDDDDFLSPHGEKKNGNGTHNDYSPTCLELEEHNDHNHLRQEIIITNEDCKA